MTIKSLLIGSAAAIVATSGAQAADAVMAADPEPVEYVQVCDAFGAGYFYIPGTETCLKIAGYVRAEATTTNKDKADDKDETTSKMGHDVRITVDAKSDSEFGTIASHVRLDEKETPIAAIKEDGKSAKLDKEDKIIFDQYNHLSVDRAHISIGDGNVLNIGLNGSIYDFSPVGEQSFSAAGNAGNQVSYSMSMDSLTIDVQATAKTNASPVVGEIVGKVGFTAGDLGVKLALGYDGSTGVEKKNARMGARVNVSYMDFALRYDWSEKGNDAAYGNGYTNVFGASYSLDASDDLTLSFAADYADSRGGVANQDAFAVSANAVYTIVENLEFDARVIYKDFSTANTKANEKDVDQTEVRLRLTRSF